MSVDIESKILDDLMKKIIDEKFHENEKLPSENELAEQYRVPRATVRKSLAKLEERGFIYSQQGVGRYVKNESFRVELNLNGKASFTDKMKQSGHQLITENLGCEQIQFDQKIYDRLSADREDNIYKIKRLRVIKNEPIAIHISYINQKVFPDIEQDGSSVQSIFAYYKERGYTELINGYSLLSVTFPTLKEQQLLACKSMEPLIMVESNCLDASSDKVLEHTKVLYRSNKFKYNISWDN
ncbi:GntR family transcriptional regulator [Gracilibacillus saliphilus]|uniref:GntR family transcriptional regulator n=1 Tax=Gracilibacillus saliphilus TaxID=543890 RepID=UPI0013D695DC|nr:GntR family transcriptional regulator [Gracilibacillus saliphilus]